MQSLKSISDRLPDEILEMILLKVETQDLLNCRLVSKRWRSFATRICRRRYVTLNLNKRGVFGSTEKTFFQTFRNSTDPPWSACSLEMYKSQSSSKAIPKPKQIKTIVFDIFGPRLLKLELRGDNIHTIFPMLKPKPNQPMPNQPVPNHPMSNLEVLICDIGLTTKEVIGACSGNYLELTKLKRLEIVFRDMGDVYVQLMEFFCKNNRSLESVLVNFQQTFLILFELENRSQDIFRRIITLISWIPSISFKISSSATMKFFKALTVPELRLKELQLEIGYDFVKDHLQYHRVLEQFLAGNSGNIGHICLTPAGNSSSLEKLNIGTSGKPRTDEPLRMPVFSKLRELTLNCISTSSLAGFLHSMSNKIPTLNKVTIQVPEQTDQDLSTVFGTVEFDSVKELTLDNYVAKNLNPMFVDWSQMFPNLVTLTVNGVTVDSYSYIYEKMTQLENLHLKVSPMDLESPNCVCVNTCYIKDPNSIICGYPKKNIQTGETAQNPSLECLSDLKTLLLDFGGCCKHEMDYPESRVHLALLKLHRLDSLTFQNIKISTEVKEKLSDYHREVKVHTPARG